MNGRRVVVTGLGVVCGLGDTWQAVWRRMLAGESAVRPWQPEGFSDFPVRYAAPVDRTAFEQRHGALPQLQEPMELRARFGLVAAQQAMADAGLHGWPVGLRTGVAVGSGTPERDTADMLLALGPGGPSWQRLYEQRHGLNPNLRDGNDHLAASIARHHGCQGPVLNFSTACAGAAHAVGTGLRLIRRGEADCMLVGGADSTLNFYSMLALHLLGAPSVDEQHGARLCRPFDLERSGLVAGEGAGMLVLEAEDHARRRGAAVHAEVCGFGSSMDAYRITAPHPEGRGAAQAMARALADAGLQPEDIDHINAHGTSTLLNDATETQAIKQVFARGEHFRRLAVNATKSQIGHLITAAGAPECLATVLALKTGWVPPTLNLEQPDPACDLDHVPHHARRLRLRAALSNSFGFGGLNAAIAFRRYGEAEE